MGTSLLDFLRGMRYIGSEDIDATTQSCGSLKLCVRIMYMLSSWVERRKSSFNESGLHSAARQGELTSIQH